MPKRKNPPANVITDATNALRLVEHSAQAAMGGALILRQLEEQYGKPADIDIDTAKLVAACNRLCKAAKRTHDRANAELDGRGLEPDGPVILPLSGGGPKD